MIAKALTKVAIFFLYLLSLLPFWVLYLISDAVFILLFYVTRYRRKVVQQNLQNAFPEKTENERAQIELQFYSYLADLMVESIKSYSISEKQLHRHFHVANPELLAHYFSQKKSVIGAVAHYGNWEMAALALSLCTTNKKIIVYKPIRNQLVEKTINRTRGKFGAQLVSMKATMRTLIALRNEQTVSVFVSDQTPVREETQYFTQFLNQQTAVFLGVEKMAKMMDNPVIFCDIRVLKRGYYCCTFVPLMNEPKLSSEHEITNLHVQYLEKVIRQAPQYWLWSHKRWKFKPEDIHR